MYHIARYDACTGDYIGICRNGDGKPLQYSLTVARKVASQFRTIRFTGFTYKPRRAR